MLSPTPPPKHGLHGKSVQIYKFFKYNLLFLGIVLKNHTEK